MARIDLSKTSDMNEREDLRRGPQRVVSDVPEQLTRDARGAVEEEYGHDDTQLDQHTETAIVGKDGTQGEVRDGSTMTLPPLPEDMPEHSPEVQDGVKVWRVERADTRWVDTPTGRRDDNVEVFMNGMWFKGEEREVTYHRYEDRSPALQAYLAQQRYLANAEAERKREATEHWRQKELDRKTSWFTSCMDAGKLVNLSGERLRKYVLDSTRAAHPEWLPTT